jgi:hypothetical protein
MSKTNVDDQRLLIDVKLELTQRQIYIINRFNGFNHYEAIEQTRGMWEGDPNRYYWSLEDQEYESTINQIFDIGLMAINKEFYNMKLTENEYFVSGVDIKRPILKHIEIEWVDIE